MKLSGYTYVKNAVEMNYPFKESIQSMLDCCDEVVVIDASNKDDGTKEVLENLVSLNEDKLCVYEYKDVDWNAPNFGIWDGKLKAIARSQCTGDFLIQMDTDEIIEENARPKIENLLAKLNWLKEVPIVATPVVEYWGSSGKVRVDVNPWKWRISRNDSKITHGIPSHLRKIDEASGLLYANHGTDGCDYIYEESGAIVPFVNFMNNDIEICRQSAATMDQAAKIYEQWFNIVVNELPTIYHFSWWSVERKIKGYEMFWNTFWPSLYNEHKPEGTNPFFKEPISSHSELEIKELAKKLEQETGGHIFHTTWSGNKTNSIQIHKSLPTLIQNWCEENKTK